MGVTGCRPFTMTPVQGFGGLAVSGLGNMGIQLHGQLGGCVTRSALHHPRVYAQFDHARDRSMAEAVKGQRPVEPSTGDRGRESALTEPPAKHPTLRTNEHQGAGILGCSRPMDSEVMG